MFLRSWSEVPENIVCFHDEAAASLETAFGKEAAIAYRSRVAMAMPDAYASPVFHVLGASLDDGPPVALLYWVEDADVHRMTYIHVLRRAREKHPEHALAELALREMHASDPDAIICDFLPLCPLDLTGLLPGFTRVDRMLMVMELRIPGSIEIGYDSVPLESRDWREAGELLAQSYSDHPDRIIHDAYHTPLQAAAFVARAVSGDFGGVAPSYARMIMKDSKLAGVALGCEVFPGTGYILQLAVAPEWRGQGIGNMLMRDMRSAFVEAGCGQAALSVSVLNPARRLYESLGYRPVGEYPALAWWRQLTSRQGAIL